MKGSLVKNKIKIKMPYNFEYGNGLVGVRSQRKTVSET